MTDPIPLGRSEMNTSATSRSGQESTADRAVSPVVGVVLLVAVTVMLAAVIATVALDMEDSIKSEPVTAVVDSEVDEESSDVYFTVTDMGTAAAFEVRGDVTGSANVSDLTETGATDSLHDSDIDDSDGTVRLSIVAIGEQGREHVVSSLTFEPDGK